MSNAAEVQENIIPLTDYPSLRRPREVKKSRATWNRMAADGKIPGAFRFNGTGPWYVHLDVHDEEVRKMASPAQKSEEEMSEISKLATMLGLDEEDIQTALEAASH